MTESQYIPMLAGLMGAIIGSVTSIITLYIQQRAHDKRERASQIYSAALEQFKMAIEVAKTKENSAIPPLAIFLYHHNLLFDLLENNNLDVESLKKMIHKEEEIERMYKDNT